MKSNCKFCNDGKCEQFKCDCSVAVIAVNLCFEVEQ